MKSRIPKILHQVAGLPMIDRVLAAASAVNPASITLVVGHGADAVRQHLAARPEVKFAVQEPQLGTAHALQQAGPALEGCRGTLLLLSGDVPLLTGDTLTRLIDTHGKAGAAATVVTAQVERPYGYGRIVRTDGQIARIVEERDASPSERQIGEINSGIYAFDMAPLFDALGAVASQNMQGEFYLTDLVSIYRRRGLAVEALLIDDPDEIRGVNSRTELAEVSALVRQKKNEELMAAGVTIVDPATTYVETNVVVGPDTVLHPGVILQGQTRIGAACEIHANVRIVDSVIGDRATVNDFCVITGATIENGASVGPFAYLRPESVLGPGSRVGTFVELKKTTLGPGSKANHLSYLGDATIGADVNIGAGTITCNFDGRTKARTVIEDNAFIGSDTQLVAPVRVGTGAYVAAGSSIVRDVPGGALGIARARQTNLEGWVERRNTRKD